MPPEVSPNEVRFDRCAVLLAARQLLIDGQPAKLGSRAFDVLTALIERRHRTVSKGELLESAWPGVVVEENNLQVQVSTLRKLLGPQVIATVPGRGYRFTAPVDGDTAAAAPTGEVSDTPPSAVGTGNLPDVLPALLGRDDELRQLRSLITTHRSVTVVGAGGIGKTRIALAAAHALRAHWPDGCWIVELSTVSDPTMLTTAVAQDLGVSLAGRKAAQDELLDALHGRHALIVLDNCEHLVDAVGAFVEAMAMRAPHVHVLATSQELLRGQDEQLLRLGSLQVPSKEELSEAHRFGAVALFVERVRALQSGFMLDGENVAAVADVCRRLDGLPLAIELAAARVPILGVHGVRERLDERLRLLTGGARTALRRHQTLRELLDWSHALLGREDQAVFRRCGVFVGSFSLPVAQEVLADDALDEWAVLDHLATLVDKSMLVVEAGEPPRYRLLESARAYALEKLRSAGETDRLMRRHARGMRAQFERVRDAYWHVPYQERIRRCRPDIDNLRAALDWAGNAGDDELLIALTGASAWLLSARSLRLEALHRCQAALARVDAATPPALEARLQLALQGALWPRLDAAGRAALARSVALFRELGDRVWLFVALAARTRDEVWSGNVAAAELAVQEMADLYEEAWPPALRSELPRARFWLLAYSDRIDSGSRPLEEMLRLAEAARDDQVRMLALLYQEQVAMTLGRPEEAVERGRALLDLARRDRFSAIWAVIAGNLGTALTELGRQEEAVPLLRETAGLYAQQGILPHLLDALALLALREQRTSDAARTLGRSDATNALRFGAEQRIRRLIERELRQALPDDELRRLMAEGAALSDEEAARIGFGD